METTKKYEVYFNISLYPEDILEFYIEETNDEIFNTYLCNEKQSKYVLEYLKKSFNSVTNISSNISTNILTSELVFVNVGKFTCNMEITITEYNVLNDCVIENIIESELLHIFKFKEVHIIINGKDFTMILKIDCVIECIDNDIDLFKLSDDEDDKLSENMLEELDNIFIELSDSDKDLDIYEDCKTNKVIGHIFQL